MLNKKMIASAIATGAILISTFAPAVFATTTIDISGNGSDSNNDATVKTTQTTTVVQNNDAWIVNEIKAKAETGENDANDNTGGDVTISTGNATSTVDVFNAVNKNIADIQNCGTCNGDTTVTISGNGSDSKNDVKLESKNEVEVFQDNKKAWIKNDIKAEAETGENDAERNTGGDVVILSGDATSNIGVTNLANANIANVGGNGDDTTDIDAIISGNGSDSKNDIDLKLKRLVTLVQDNDAWIVNYLKAEAETGENDANDNTGGDVLIATGDATATVNIDNMANFNSAEADCCLIDISATVSGNGSDSKNKIKAELENKLDIFQDNKAKIENELEAEAETGENDAERNTDSNGAEVIVVTGDATDEVGVSNASNLNGVGNSAEIELPGGLSLNILFDLSVLWSLLP
ncbi:hypothetical protein HY385_00610 [Candidatus Daviesbacteria bacterium]|nr:hypothetical protein [Candidatus Daviesbacteria bacterium]